MDRDQWRDCIARNCAVLDRTDRESLRFVTIILAVEIVRDPSTQWVIPDAVWNFSGDLAKCMRESGNTRRGTRWAGSIEFDLVHPAFLGSGKAGLGAELGVDVANMGRSDRLLISHAHFVLDASGHHDVDDAAAALRRTWPGPRRVHVATLHADKSVAMNLDRLAGYMGKLNMRYAKAWLGRRTEFGPALEPEWKLFAESLVMEIGFDQMLVSNVTSRAAVILPECTAATPKVEQNKELVAAECPLQLNIEGVSHVQGASRDISNDLVQDNYENQGNDDVLSDEDGDHSGNGLPNKPQQTVLWYLEAVGRLAPLAPLASRLDLSHPLADEFRSLERATRLYPGLAWVGIDADDWTTRHDHLERRIRNELGLDVPVMSSSADLIQRVRETRHDDDPREPGRAWVADVLHRIRMRTAGSRAP